jgi:hypothetical protein
MRRHIVAGWGAVALGAGIAIGAVLGPLALGIIRFRTSENAENQFIGGEVVSLGLVAPALVVAGVLWLRQRRLAPALAFGPALYAVYTYVTAIVGQEYARYPGNVETFFPLYALLVAGGAAMAAIAGAELAGSDAPMPPDRLRRIAAGLFLAIGAFFALAWAAQIRLVYIGQPPVEYQEGPTLFWIIKLLDLGFLIPALIATGSGLIRRHPIAVKAAYGLAPFGTCMASAVAGMAIAMEIRGDPTSNPVMLLFVIPVAGALAFVTVKLLASFAAGSGQERPAGAVMNEWTAQHAH